MQAGRRLLMRHPRLGLVILALVLGLRVLIPPGMMPVADRAGGLVVTLCDGSGPATARTITLAAKPDKSGENANPGPCAFGILAEALLGGGEPPALPLPAPLVGLITPALAAALALAAIARTRPPARAPPVARFARFVPLA